MCGGFSVYSCDPVCLPASAGKHTVTVVNRIHAGTVGWKREMSYPHRPCCLVDYNESQPCCCRPVMPATWEAGGDKFKASMD